MSKLIAFTCIAALSLAYGADEKDGGLVKVAGKGSLAIIDCRAGLDWAKCAPTLDKFNETFRIAVEKRQGEPFAIETAAEAVRRSGANAVLFVGDRPDYPMSLTASEQKWAFVNLAPLKAAAINFDRRCQYLLMRGIYRALGSDVSRADKSCLSPVYSPEDLDKISDMGVAMDTFIAVNESCEALGIEPVEYLTFREACELENPPTPTNDVQRAIAAEVKAARKKQNR